MSREALKQAAGRRVVMCGLGFAFGAALWLVAENWDNPVLPPALYLALFSFTAAYAGTALALAGPLPVARALRGALLLAVPVTLLVSMAGQRFADPASLLDQPAILAVCLLLALLALPFVTCWLQDRRSWRTYSGLFEAAWGLFVRGLAGWFFVGVFWLLAFLSDALLELVGVRVIEWVLKTEWLVFAFSGGVLGLALAVAHELRELVSPRLLLRLLRLLSVPVLAVVAVFLAAIPLRGLGDAFGALSAAGTLMSVGVVMITLVSVALDSRDGEMPQSRAVSAAARMLALLLPLVTGIAAWAVLLRVRQYGWTPDRVLAALAAGFLLAYGLSYAAAALRGGGWTGRIRQVNVWMALAALLACAAFLTPLLNGWRIAASDQVARYASGRAALEQLPLWELDREWGKAGQGALDRLAALAAGADGEALGARLAELRAANTRWEFDSGLRGRKAEDLRAELAELVPARPAGARLAAEDLEGLPAPELEAWLAGCRRSLPDGRPGCIFVLADLTAAPGREALMFYRTGAPEDGVAVRYLQPGGDRPRSRGVALLGAGAAPRALQAGVIEELLDGNYDTGPSSLRALRVGGAELVPRP
ncbi:DUF4153 domain-containing protein [Roseobacteraceae bacterium NS-SX3]